MSQRAMIVCTGDCHEHVFVRGMDMCYVDCAHSVTIPSRVCVLMRIDVVFVNEEIIERML
jgi:hypothetical protein